MVDTPRKPRLWLLGAATLTALLLIAGGLVWRDDILRTGLDPKEPFQTYDPPPAPDYAEAEAWLRRPESPQTWSAEDPPADVFFVGPTAYEGGRHWNAPLQDAQAEAFYRRTVEPNYAAPFSEVGRIFAPRYRQASLYSLLTLRDDAREARRFAYGDVQRAFRRFLTDYNQGRPFFIVGVEQGGTLALRLLDEEVATDPDLRRRLVAAFLIETAVQTDRTPIPPCEAPTEPGCLAAWLSVYEGDRDRAQTLRDRSLVWNVRGELVNLTAPPLCFNPILGHVSDGEGPARMARGATNATGLEWGARPGLQTRQISAQCQDGVLRVSRPRSGAFKRTGGWAEQRKVAGYNLFYGDLEANAEARLRTLLADPDFLRAAQPITQRRAVPTSPVHRID